MGTFFDSFLPNLTGSLAQAGPGALQGHMQGLEASKQLALLDAKLRHQALQEQQLQQQMMLATRPQPIQFHPGAMYGTMDPLTGKQTMAGQVPITKDPAQEALYRAQEQKALAEANAYRMFGGMKPTGNFKQMYEMKKGMGVQTTPAEDQEYQTIIRQSGGIPGGTSMLDSRSLDLMADQYLAGDTSVFQNLGRGMQGAENINRLRGIIASKAQQQGLNGPDLASRIAELQGVKSGERILGNRMASFGMAQQEAGQMADLVVQASEQVPRTQFMPINRALMSYNTMTGDPATRQFGAALNSFINAYARAINPSGVPTVSDKEHAREMLETADSHQALVAIMAQLQKEIAAAGQAPGQVKQELKRMIPGAKMGPAAESPIKERSPLVQQHKQQTQKQPNFVKLYDALSSEQQAQLSALYREWNTGAKSDEEFRKDALASTGNAPEVNAVLDQLIARRKRK